MVVEEKKKIRIFQRITGLPHANKFELQICETDLFRLARVSNKNKVIQVNKEDWDSLTNPQQYFLIRWCIYEHENKKQDINSQAWQADIDALNDTKDKYGELGWKQAGRLLHIMFKRNPTFFNAKRAENLLKILNPDKLKG
jgi:translation initiation factor IF-1